VLTADWLWHYAEIVGRCAHNCQSKTQPAVQYVSFRTAHISESFNSRRDCTTQFLPVTIMYRVFLFCCIHFCIICKKIMSSRVQFTAEGWGRDKQISRVCWRSSVQWPALFHGLESTSEAWLESTSILAGRNWSDKLVYSALLYLNTFRNRKIVLFSVAMVTRVASSQYLHYYITLCPQKKSFTGLTCDNLDTHEYVLMIFHRNVTYKLSNQKLLYFLTSPDRCLYSSLQNSKRINSVFSLKWCMLFC